MPIKYKPARGAARAVAILLNELRMRLAIMLTTRVPPIDIISLLMVSVLSSEDEDALRLLSLLFSDTIVQVKVLREDRG